MGPDANGISFEVGPSARVHDMDEGIGLPEIVKKLVAQPATFVCVRDQTRNIEHLYRHEPSAALAQRVVRIAGFAELDMRTLATHVADSPVWLDSRERIGCDLGCRQRERREECGLANIWLSDYAD